MRLYQKLEAGGQDATLDVYEGMNHVFQQYGIPESEIAIAKSAAFIRKHLGIDACDIFENVPEDVIC